MDIINILGINISTLNKNEFLEKIEHFLFSGKQHQITTPNPEFIMEARRDEEFFYVLNSSDLAVPDAVGLKIAGWFLGKNLKRYPGADLVKDILKLAEEKKLRVAVLNWSGGLSKEEDIEKSLKEKYPNLFFLVKDIEKKEATEYASDLESVSQFNPDILLATLGAPLQEKLIYHNLENLPSVKIAIGAGGALDFLTKKIKRAPAILRFIGLEWLWRLAKQPKRLKRIYNATIIFSLTFLKSRFIHPFLYRKNVVCLLYKKEDKKYKILLVERASEKNHWQLPQGGTDGEKTNIAGARELKEELNTDKFKPIMSYHNLWAYEFGDKLSKFGVSSRLVWGYKGQKQNLFIAEFLGCDEDIKINFWEHTGWEWIDAENLLKKIYPARRKSAEIFLEKFKQNI